MKKLISKILIANRGEIACRIIRSARKLGIRTVAVYSEVDKNALNVLMSDEAYCIGGAASRESYLNQDKIIDVAKRSQCEAIHPGYGFLSENAAFAEYCDEHDIIFIGPPASAIRDMGIKSKSKEIMIEANVPVIPGYHGSEQSNSFLESRALEIGFPLMIKAVLGGGGKGMRVVTKKEEFISKLESARRESQNSFGDQNVLLEKFIVAPRHIEFQIFADRHGNCVHLNERDCSVQRRHQKVIEEAPAPRIDSKQRAMMGSAAVRAAEAVNYEGAGTVEFIYDEANRTFYFMEMNTRLQVEHPITEMITGTDLVEWQIKVASGEPLPVKQDDIPVNGHAVEARIYAEDPYDEFLPCAGPLAHFDPPRLDKFVRVETGVREGDDVSVHYDPMLAKLIAWGEDRNQAFTKLRNKLIEFNVTGLTTNINFLIALCGNPKLLNGEVNTAFIEENKNELLGRLQPSAEIIAQAIVGLILWEKKNALEEVKSTGNPYNPFVTESGFRLNHAYERLLKLHTYDGSVIESKVTYKESDSFSVQVNGKTYDLSGYLIEDGLHKVQFIAHLEDRVLKSKLVVQDEEFVHLFTLDGSFCFKIWSPKFGASSSEYSIKDAVAPMPGIVSNIFVKPGDKVAVGDPLLVIIAMKMEHVVKSPQDGIVKNVFFEIGQNISKNALVAKLEAQ